MAKTRKKGNPRRDFKDKIYDFIKTFTENTSCHGVRYTFGAETCFGRTVWLLVVIAFFVWFTYQVGERAAYYQKNPVTVNVNVAYNSSLKFPSVAICNTNQFRMSRAWEAGIYRKLEAFYGADRHARKNIPILDDLDLFQTKLDMAHRKEDLIKRCTWKGNNCSHHNFTNLMTDFGVCYIFNDLQANESIRDPNDYKVENTGASFGLQLILNAEEYERSPGPRFPAGIQVLIFNGNDQPRVSDLGTAAPVFKVSRAALHVSSVSRLPKPHGDCASKILRDYPVYSYQACRSEVLSNATARQCGCIGYGQRWAEPDTPPYCNLSTMYGCYRDAISRSFPHTCTHPCQQDDYTTTLSNTDLAMTSISEMMDIFKLDKTLLAKYRKAVLLRQLVDKDIIWKDLDMLNNLYSSHENLQVKIQTPLRDGMSKIKEEIHKALPALASLGNRMDGVTKDLIKNYEFVFRVQTIENYLKPALVKLEMRTWELAITTLPWGLKPNMFNDDPRAQNIANHLKGELQRYFSQSSALIYSVEKMYNLYTIKILKENANEYDGMSVPRKIINIRRGAIIKAIHKFSHFGRVLRDKMQQFQNMAKQLDSVNKTEFEGTLYHAMWAAANDINKVSLNQFRSSARELHEEMMKVSNTLSDTIERFQDTHVEVKKFFSEILILVGAYQWKMSRYDVHAVESVFTAVVRRSHLLIPAWQNITKERLVELVTPASNFTNAITKYRRGRDVLMNTLNKLQATKIDSAIMNQVYNAITAVQKDLPALSVAFARDAALVIPMLYPLHNTFKHMYGRIDHLEDAMEEFLMKFEDFLEEMVSFNKSLHIDEDMIRKNVLALDVYYQSLSLTEVIKSPAYTWFSLLSEIGGSAGLFLGGSFLTILELVYFVGRHCRVPHTIAATEEKIIHVQSIDSRTISTGKADKNVFSITMMDSDRFIY